MSWKSRFSFLFRKFDVVHDRAALPVLWVFGTLMLVVGLLLLIGGLRDGLEKLTSSGLLMLVFSMSMFRLAIGARRQIKAFDAKKTLEAPLK